MMKYFKLFQIKFSMYQNCLIHLKNPIIALYTLSHNLSKCPITYQPKQYGKI